MNKRQMLQALEGLPDDAEIYIWSWSDTGAHIYVTNLGLSQPDDCLLLVHERCRAHDVTKEWNNSHRRASCDELLTVCSWCGELYDSTDIGADDDYCSYKCRSEEELSHDTSEL